MEACKRNASVSHRAALLVGQDLLLLQTRSLILQAAGYIVCSASLEEAPLAYKNGGFDVVILCHSVPVADRERLTRLIRDVRSLTPVVSIAHWFGEYDTFSDATIEPDPKRLLSGLGEALTRSGRERASNTT